MKNPDAVAGFCRVANIEELRQSRYVLTPGRYVGSPEIDEEGEPIEERLPRLASLLQEQFTQGEKLQASIMVRLRDLST
jgi:type I restriction enzyme M protein